MHKTYMKGKKHVYCVHFNYKTLQKNLLFSNFFSFKCNFCFAFSNKKNFFSYSFSLKHCALLCPNGIKVEGK